MPNIPTCASCSTSIGPIGDSVTVIGAATTVWGICRDAWLRYWFTPERPENLGAARAIFFAGVLLLYVQEDFSAWATVDRVFWMPIWAFDRLGLEPTPPAALELIEWVFKGALLCGAVGFATRVASGVACLLGFYLLGLPHNFGQTYHFDALLVFVFGILAMARSGDAVAIQALRTPRRMPSGEYRWPVRLIWLTTATIFFAAGFAKLRRSGLDWAFSDNMSNILIKAHYGRSDADPLVDWGLFIAQTPVLSQGLALMSLLLESTFPLALVSRTARLVLVPGVFMMLVGIRVLMGPTFGGFLFAFAFWIPWSALGGAVRAAWPARGRYAMLFDGSCGVCRRTVEIVQRLDVLGRVDVLDAAQEWEAVETRYSGLSQRQCLEQMHVLRPGGRIARGFDGYRALARALPIAWPALPLLYLPGARHVGARVYNSVARRRHRHGCAWTPGQAAGSIRR